MVISSLRAHCALLHDLLATWAHSGIMALTNFLELLGKEWSDDDIGKMGLQYAGRQTTVEFIIFLIVY